MTIPIEVPDGLAPRLRVAFKATDNADLKKKIAQQVLAILADSEREQASLTAGETARNKALADGSTIS